MNYMSDKVNSFAGDAMSGVNEMRRKWKQTRSRADASLNEQQGQQQQQQQQQQSTISAINTHHEQANTQHKQTRVVPPPQGLTTTTQTRQRLPRYACTMTSASGRSPLAGGIPFGGDSFTSGPVPSPPPIGFRIDALHSPEQIVQDVTSREPTSIVVEHSPDGPPHATHTPPVRPPRAPAKNQLQSVDSSESLYKADAWARLWFPRVMILCLLRMLLFIRKVYEDYRATEVYQLRGKTGFFMISAMSLLLPTLVFTLYRVSRYLQLVLPAIRLAKAEAPHHSSRRTQSTGVEISKSSTPHFEKTHRDEWALTRALMTSSPESVTSAGTGQQRVVTPTSAQEGLVTARQSPLGVSPEMEFHDSSSEIVQASSSRTDPAPAAPAKLESVNVDKLGNLPDKDNVRVFLGATEQALHGILFVFWQLKRQVDVMGYLVERACLWRKPAEREKEELARLRTGSDGLEWFQDFYAAFLAIMAQVYMLSAHWHIARIHERVPAAIGSPVVTTDYVAPATEGSRIWNSFFGTQSLVSSTPGGGQSVLLVSELVVSCAVILSLLICVRRRDDGPLTLGLSMLGWGSLFAARIIAISLAFVHLSWRLMTLLIVLHVLGMTGWIYSIALASHNDLPSERLDEAEWDSEVGEHAAGRPSSSGSGGPVGGELELEENNTTSTPTARVTQPPARTTETSSWSLAEHLALISQIISLFAIPSLFYWPIMFNLKLHLRPFKYLVLILIQNFLLIPAIWYNIASASSRSLGQDVQPTSGQMYLMGAVGACSVVGFIFVSLYVACKPSLTEYFARADELFNEAEQSGIYYEFCSRVFKMPDLSRSTFTRLMDQSEELVEERYELVSEPVSRSA